MLTPFSIRAVHLAKLPLLGPEEVRLIEFFVAGSPTAQCIADLRDAMPQDLMHGWLAGKLRASSMLVDSSVLSSMAGKLWVASHRIFFKLTAGHHLLDEEQSRLLLVFFSSFLFVDKLLSCLCLFLFAFWLSCVCLFCGR